MRILKKLVQGYSNNKTIFGFDVETYHIPRGDYIEQRFLMGSIVSNNYRKVFWDRESMQDCIKNSHDFRNTTLFATNLDFDFKHVFLNTKYYDECRKINRHGSLIYAKHRYNKHIVDFNDTMNFVPLGVEKMAVKMGMKKLQHPACFGRMPKTQSEKVEMEEYNINDAMITQRFAVKLQDFFNRMGCKQKHTIASTGVDYWRRYGQPHDLFQEREAWIRKHYEGSLKGGRTECIKRGYVQDAYYYDFNSHYPARCYYGVDGKGSYPDPSSSKYTDKVDEELILEYEGISKVKVKSPEAYLPLLGLRIGGKLVFPKGEFSGWFTNVELRTALKNGYELLDCGEGIYYERNFIPFRSVVKTLYDLRRHFIDIEKDEVFGQMCKTMMNSGLFGKFAQKLDGFEQEYSVDDAGVDKNGQFFIKINGKDVYPDEYHIRNKSIYVKEQCKRIPIFIMPILSSYTTALGRIKLWEEIVKKAEYLHYTDTDSAAFSKKCISHSMELGELKLETVLKEAVFVRPKFYFANDGTKEWVKCKGVGKSLTNKVDFDHLYESGSVVTERFAKSKECAIREIPFSSILKVCKKISFNDDKRVWKGNFNPLACDDSEAHVVKNGMTAIEKKLQDSKALDAYRKLNEKETQRFINSDLFDSFSAGKDDKDKRLLYNSEKDAWRHD